MAEKPRDAAVKFDTHRNVQIAASRAVSLRQRVFLYVLWCESKLTSSVVLPQDTLSYNLQR